MSREQIIAEMRERANDLREQGKLASANAMDDFAERLAALTASPQAAPEGDPAHREFLGQIVRMEWEKWAREQPNPKPSWLTPWCELTEPEREVDRRIGERIYSMAIGALYASPQVQGGEDAAERALDALDDACMAMNRNHSNVHRVTWTGYSRAQRIAVMRAALEAALASGPSGECQHRWQPDADVEGAVYCPKCDVTRSARAAAQDQGEGNG
jgi:hypothetical protein